MRGIMLVPHFHRRGLGKFTKLSAGIPTRSRSISAATTLTVRVWASRVNEPMCGGEKSVVTKSHHPPLLTAETNSRSVVVAESNNSLASTESISQPCRMDCGACATLAARQLKRQKSAVPARVAYAAPVAVTTTFETDKPFVLSSEFWTRITPRGPPAELL